MGHCIWKINNKLKQKNKNKSGPNIDPRGTSERRARGSEKKDWCLTT